MCNITKFIPACPGFNIKGIKEVGFLPFGNAYKIEQIGDKYTITTSVPFTRFWFTTQTGFFEENLVITSNDKYLEVSLKLDFQQLNYANRSALNELLELECIVYVVDNKNKKWLLGVKKGMTVNKHVASTGTPKSGLNGFELQWIGRGLGEVEIIELPACDGTVINGQCVADEELIIVANRYGLSTGNATGGLVDTEIETNTVGFNYNSNYISKNGSQTAIPFPITSDTVQSEHVYNIFGTAYKVSDYFLGNANPLYLRVGLNSGASTFVDKSTRTVTFGYKLRWFVTPSDPTYKLHITKPDQQTDSFDLFTGIPADNTDSSLVYNYEQLGVHRATIEITNNGVISAKQTFYFILV
jgi:hypothetical protein